jgi:hypothetical protein
MWCFNAAPSVESHWNICRRSLVCEAAVAENWRENSFDEGHVDEMEDVEED